MSKITDVITLKQYANKYELDGKRVRRLARKNEFPGEFVPFKFGNVWAIDANAPKITLPAKSTRGNRREDGRQRFIVYANAVEFGELNDMDIEIVNPRIASKSRRDARKLTKMSNAIDELSGGDNE